MTERRQPFSGSRFEAQSLERPPRLSEEVIGAPTEVIKDKTGNEFGVHVFESGGQLPFGMSEWLHYQSFTDEGIGTMTADDLYRFEDPWTTRNLFLVDKDGRRASIAVGKSEDHDGEVAGIVWLRPLQDDLKDAAMIRSVEAPETTATLAARIYEPHRGQRLSAPLITTAIHDYFETYEDCSGIVIRVNQNDATAIGAFEREGKNAEWRFRHVANAHGVAIMYYARPKDIEILRHQDVQKPVNDLKGFSLDLVMRDPDGRLPDLAFFD